jgi:aryl-alcohol dehydrogenase-like predicted oxidoreductase
LAVAPNMLLIPGTSSLRHLAENLAVADVVLDDDALREVDGSVERSCSSTVPQSTSRSSIGL